MLITRLGQVAGSSSSRLLLRSQRQLAVPALISSGRQVAKRTGQVRQFAAQRTAPKKQSTSSSSSNGNGTGADAAPRVTKEMVAHELKEILKLMFGGVTVVGGLLASSGFVIETTRSMKPMAGPGSIVELADEDGNPLSVHVQRRGVGDTTVIFDGGIGETSFDWDKVSDQVAAFANVMAIDRPGLGFSAASSSPRTSTQIAKEYQQILHALNVSGKVILVAHGAGGYNMRELAGELDNNANSSSQSCVGLVLVDALEEHLRNELESVSDRVRESLAAIDANGDTVLWLSRFGLIRLINFVQQSKFAEKYSPAALPFVQHFLPSPAHRTGVQQESEALPLTEQQFRDAPSAPKFQFPCIVLSHGKNTMFEAMKVQSGIDDATVAALEGKWNAAQEKLAQSVSARSTRVVVKDASHAIHHERPDEIVRAVRRLVEEARA